MNFASDINQMLKSETLTVDDTDNTEQIIQNYDGFQQHSILDPM